MANIAIMGFGTVGAGVAEVARMNHDSIAAKIGEEMIPGLLESIRSASGERKEYGTGAADVEESRSRGSYVES